MRKTTVLWGLLAVEVTLILAGITGVVKGDLYNLFMTCLPLVLLVLHACWTLGPWRALAFIMLASSTGFAAEAISLHYGTLFGGTYSYPNVASLWGVPLAVITFWAVFIYMGYWLITSFRYWWREGKPAHTKDGLGLVALLVICDGLAVTAIDLLMDPVSVAAGAWTWEDGGPYFGVPIGNFIGWFCVTVVVTGIFRLFEYYRPTKLLQLGKSVLLIPVLAYFLAGIIFFTGAIEYEMPTLAVIGTIIVIIPAMANVLFYIHSKTSIETQQNRTLAWKHRR